MQFARFLWHRFNEINIPLVSGSLTFTTLLALVPLFTVTVVVIAAFPMFADIANRFNDFLTGIIIPNAGADSVGSYLLQFRQKASNLTAIGILIMMLTSVLLIQTIERTFNQIWRVRQTRSLLTRMLVYWALLTLGPLVLGLGLSVLGYVLSRSVLAIHFPFLAALTKIVSSIGVITLLLFLMYKIVPYRYVPTRHALLGALLTAVLLEVTRRGFGIYIAHFNSYQLVYGAFAAIPVFLLWLNLLWMILLSGALLTASLSYWQDDAYARQLSRNGRFDDVLKILLLLHQAQNQHQVLSIRDFRQHISMGYDELGDLLAQLAQHQLVICNGDGWALKTNAEHIALKKLFHWFVYQPDNQDNSAVTQTINAMLAPGMAAMDLSLADFIAHHQQQTPIQPTDTTTV